MCRKNFVNLRQQTVEATAYYGGVLTRAQGLTLRPLIKMAMIIFGYLADF